MATKTTKQPKYYEAIDILMYIVYFCIFVAVCVLGMAISWHEGTKQADRYIEIELIVFVVFLVLTFVLGALAKFSNYNVLYTMFHK